MSDFWTIYENEIRERFRLDNTLVKSESHRELIDFEILIGMKLLRPRKIKVQISDAKNNEGAEKEQYFCQKCNEQFETKFGHMKEKHSNECPYCPAIYATIWNLRKHIKKQHPTLFNEYVEDRKMEQEANSKKRAHFCEKCNEEFKTKFSHMIEKHPSHCPYCPEVYSDVSNLGRHIKNQHVTLYNDFLEGRKLRTYREAEENLKKHACKICQKKFRCPSDLRKHEPTHRKFKEKLFACKICKKRYTTLFYVLEHTKEFHGSIKYNCKLCNFQTMRPYKLRMHEKSMHLNFPK